MQAGKDPEVDPPERRSRGHAMRISQDFFFRIEPLQISQVKPEVSVAGHHWR